LGPLSNIQIYHNGAGDVVERRDVRKGHQVRRVRIALAVFKIKLRGRGDQNGREDPNQDHDRRAPSHTLINGYGAPIGRLMSLQ